MLQPLLNQKHFHLNHVSSQQKRIMIGIISAMWSITASLHVLESRGSQIFQNRRGSIKILHARWGTWPMFHTEDPQMLGATIQNFVVAVLPGIVAVLIQRLALWQVVTEILIHMWSWKVLYIYIAWVFILKSKVAEFYHMSCISVSQPPGRGPVPGCERFSWNLSILVF